MKTIEVCELCCCNSGRFEGADRAEALDACHEYLRDNAWYEHSEGRWLCPECVAGVVAWARESLGETTPEETGR